MNIFKATISSFNKKDLKLMKKGEEVAVEDTFDEFFSSLDKALVYLKEKLSEFEDPDEVVAINVFEIPLDNSDAPTQVHFFDKDLNSLGVFDHDQTYPSPKFAKNDWVLFIQGGSLKCGLVEEPGNEEGPYLIVYEDSNLRDCSPHDHTHELLIVKKISVEEAKELLPTKYYENILRRVAVRQK